MIYDNVLQTIGDTPIIRVRRLAPEGVEMYVKVEAFNPMSSVKDRLALGVILDAEKRGALEPGQTVIEATSGNTGIALAMVCAAKGYPLVVTMADSFSVERRRLMRFLGNLRDKFVQNVLFFLPVGIGGVIGVVAFSAVVDFAFTNYAG